MHALRGNLRLYPRFAGAGLALCIVALSIGLAVPPSASASGLPDGVPDLFSPEAGQDWRAVHVGDVHGNEDLPVLMVTDTQGRKPAMLIGLDARNGTAEYSLESDPVIFVALLGPETVTTLYYDTGFAATGEPSGQFRRIAHPALAEMPDFVRSIMPIEAQAEAEGLRSPAQGDPFFVSE